MCGHLVGSGVGLKLLCTRFSLCMTSDVIGQSTQTVVLKETHSRNVVHGFINMCHLPLLCWANQIAHCLITWQWWSRSCNQLGFAGSMKLSHHFPLSKLCTYVACSPQETVWNVRMWNITVSGVPAEQVLCLLVLHCSPSLPREWTRLPTWQPQASQWPWSTLGTVWECRS